MMYCQKCRTPLKLDSSLSELNPAAFNLLLGATNPSALQSKESIPCRPYPLERKALYDQASNNVAPSIEMNGNGFAHDTDHQPTDTSKVGLKDSQAMSFHMLSESEMVVSSPSHSPDRTGSKKQAVDHHTATAPASGEGKTLSHEVERVSKLFEILSARSDIDHPVCVECTEILVDGLQKRLEAATKERDAYIGFLKHVKSTIPTEEEHRDSEAQVAQAQADEEAALQELLNLEREKAEIDREILELEGEARDLDQQEEEFWRERNAFAVKLTDFQNARDSINLKYDHDCQQLEKLQRTNVYNDTFCISHDGSFGTINGLRLGRLSSIPVDWPEINAAWGYTLLLLATVADCLSFAFENYELQPMGSTSRIIKVEHASPLTSRTGASSTNSSTTTRRTPAPKRVILELYSSGDMPLGLTFMHRKFDLAMVAFLDCMRQLGTFVEAQTAQGGRPIKLPYSIEGDKIGEISIKLGIAQDDDWSKACKFALTCCKFLLAHASTINLSARRSAT